MLYDHTVLQSVLHCDFARIVLARVYNSPVQPSMWCDQLQQNLVCMQATWNSLHRLMNESDYIHAYMYLFYLCISLNIMFSKVLWWWWWWWWW